MRPLLSRIPQPVAAKVPEVTVLFWVIKILSTGMGEAASDWLGNTNLVLGGLVGVGGLGAVLWLQLRATRYVAARYWFAVAMVAVFGTMVADILHVATGLSYWATSAFYAAAVALCFTLWWRSEGTLSVHSIRTTRREFFYWSTVLATFALGTAVGDLTGLTVGWGFFASGLLFGAMILVPLAAWRLGANSVVCFWGAYVVTRPLGASFADWVGKEHDKGGGLGVGDGPVTGVLVLLIVILVAWVARSVQDVQRAQALGAAEHERARPGLSRPA